MTFSKISKSKKLPQKDPKKTKIQQIQMIEKAKGSMGVMMDSRNVSGRGYSKVNSCIEEVEENKQKKETQWEDSVKSDQVKIVLILA